MDGAERQSGSDSLLPSDIVAALTATSHGDTVTLYLSNPAAPYDRASYVLLACAGITPDHAAEMWGPLPPRSLDLFSAGDKQKRLVLTDIAQEPRFARSRFAINHQLRSLLRLSIRMPISGMKREPNVIAGIIPPFAEVFVGYRTARTAGELDQAADRVLACVLKNAREILTCEAIAQLIDPRRVAIRHRRLHRFAESVRGQGDGESSLRRRSDRLRAKRWIADDHGWICRFLGRELGLGEDQYAISVHSVEDWRDPNAPTHDRSDLRAIDVHPIHATRNVDRETLRHKLRANPNRGICRYVAAFGTSVVLADVRNLTARWRQIFLDGVLHGASLTFPLFQGGRVFAVVHVEVVEGIDVRASAQRIWQVLPMLESTLWRLMREDEEVDDAAALAVIKGFSSFPLGPRRKALRDRMSRIRRELRLQACSLIVCADTTTFEVWRSPDVAPTASAPASGEHPRQLCQAIASCVDGPRIEDAILTAGAAARNGFGSILCYTRDRASDRFGRRVPTAPTATLKRLLAEHLAPFAASQPLSGDLFVLPIVHKLAAAEAPTTPFAILTLVADNLGGSLSRRSLERLLDLGQAMTSSLEGIDRKGLESTLFAWATAGIGSIHDVVNALGRSAEVLRDNPPQEEVSEIAELILAIKKQLALIDALAHGGRPTTTSERIELSTFVRAIVREAAILAGHPHRNLEVKIQGKNREFALDALQRDRIPSVLLNVVANAFKYGNGKMPVVTACLERQRMTITVENQAYRERFAGPLAEAEQIVDRVRTENPAQVLYSIIRNAPRVAGLKGIGVWLTARIVKEVLGGEFHIRQRPTDDPELLIVESRADFPVHRARHKPDSGARPAGETGGG